MKKRGAQFVKWIERYILLKNQSLITKLWMFSTVLVILPVLSVGIITYMFSSNEIEKEFRESSLQIIKQVELHIEYYLQEFEITSLKIINSPEIASILKQEPIANDEGSTLAEEAFEVLKKSEYSRNDISNITVMLDNGFIIDLLRDKNYYSAINIKDEYWYSSLPENGMVMLVSRTLKLKDKELPVISLVRRLYNPHTLKPIGLLIIDINFKRIEEISKMVNINENSYFFILDSKGHYVYHPDETKLGNKVKFRELANLEDEKSGDLVIVNDQREFVSYSLSQNLGWRFFTAVPYQDLRKGIHQIGTVITWTIFISLIIAYVAGFFGLTKTIVHPIQRLHAFMKEVEVGNLKSKVKVDSSDEIGQLSNGFNSTVAKLSTLLEEVYISKLKEAELSLTKTEIELKMLQSQINPHFLYNSLETIRGMALEEGQEDIAEISSSLGKLLRYNLRNSSSTVCLHEEMKFSEMYLQIQKLRFEDRVEYDFEIPESLRECQVVKFSLQPIIENCFVHSIGPDAKNIKITISAMVLGDSSLVIRITDTGMGMNKEQLDDLTEKFNKNVSTLAGQHIGIMNVQQRIRSLYGPEYGISIKSIRGLGTEVSLQLPIVIEKEVKS